MKHIFAVLMALVLLLNACCLAESEMSMEDQALNTVSLINSFMSDMGVLNEQQILSGYQVVAEDEVFGFGNSENSLTALVIGNPETNALSSFSLICDAEAGVMPAAQYCINVPLVQLINYESQENEADFLVDMEEMGAFLDTHYQSVLDALNNGESFSAAYVDSDYFSIEWSVTPVNDAARMLLAYYFYPLAAE